MRLAAAVDIGGTSTKIGIVGDEGHVVERASISTSAAGDPLPLMEAIVSTLRPMLDALAAKGTEPLGIGVSVAGFLDAGRSMMIENANLRALCGFPLRPAFEERFANDCRLEVDSNAAVLAEYRYGAGQGVRRLLGVTIGTGLGGGVIIDGALLRHTGQCAGDVGHIILDPDGAPCSCGARGCLEALVSSAALSRRAGGRPVRDVITSARAGDKESVTALAETGWWLGLGLASLSPLFAPDAITVGGGMAAAGELLMEPTRASYHEHAAPDHRRRVRITGSRFHGWEGMVGAACLILSPLP
jgi:glucokinase